MLPHMRFAIRENVLRMTPYSPGKPIDEVKRELGLTDVVKLASNENPLGPPPAAVRAVQEAAARMHLYPDAAAYDLRQALARHLDVQPEQVALGNGSDELIHMLGEVFLSGPGDTVLTGVPSFVRYDAAAHLAGSQLRQIPVDADYRLDLPAMAETLDATVRLVFVANPNNPTGTVVSDAEVRALIRQLPEGAALVLDEAYREYAEDLSGYPDTLAMIREGMPVIGMRTFSKAYGLAGIRVGYMVGPAEIMDAFHRAREPFNVNALAQVAAIAALGDHEHLARSKQVNREGLARMSRLADQYGMRALDSHANFACLEVGDGPSVFESLLRQGVIVRSGHVVGMPSFIRVSIGTPAEMDRFEEAFRNVWTAGIPTLA
jgi:histidinol-phosphate aminotransferase